MDRRQQKTRAAIFSAFSELLSRKSYSKITVQDIIDEANVGRTTFYAHFETKDDLLKELCTDIFDHVISSSLNIEPSHDFSLSGSALSGRFLSLRYIASVQLSGHGHIKLQLLLHARADMDHLGDASPQKKHPAYEKRHKGTDKNQAQDQSVFPSPFQFLTSFPKNLKRTYI